MKSYKVFAYLLIALPALLLQSCLKDDEDKFPESSSARAQEYLTAAQDTLMGSTYGWILDYYPQSSQSYGGYTYAVKFDKDQATVYFENQPGKSETSLYSMKSDDGPVLSFDTYNSMIHFFATPSGDLNNGYEGDFEFVVDSIGHDAVKVHGKRSLNTMYFRRLNEPAADYMNKVISMGDSFGLYAAVGTVGGQEAQMVFDRSNRQVKVAVDTTYFESAYNYTDKGIKLYEPVNAEGVTVDEINYNDADLSLTSDNGTQLSGIFDPSIITTAIGSIGADDNAFSRKFKNLPHLDQFNFVADDDWCTVTANGSTLTVNGTANTTGELRSTTVYVVSKLTRQVYDSFTVSQMNQSDILGDYTFNYLDYDGAQHKASATITSSKNALTLTVSTELLGNDFELTFPCKFSQANGALAIQSGQVIYPDELTLTSAGKKVNGWIMSGLSFNGGNYQTNYFDSFYGYMPFAHNAKVGTYATLGTVSGSLLPGSYDFSGILLYFATAQQPQSADDMAGLIDEWTKCTLIKKSAGGAKGNTVIPVTNGRETKVKKPFRSLSSQGFKLIK